MMCVASNGMVESADSEIRGADANYIHIGLVNNMPGSALEATERQFCTLLDAAAEGILVRVSLYALAGVPRSHADLLHINDCYSDIDCLWNTRLDGLIVTGAEPRAPALKDEPYWGSLATLLEWAEHNTYSSIWSCLAAHAAVLESDGIERCPLSGKRFGLFECAKVHDDPVTAKLTSGVPERLQVPHSRWNDIPSDALKTCGYHVLTRSEDGGIDAFVKQRKSLFVLFQGHPEYDADSLLLEYRRDIRRFLRRERGSYPSLPRGCFDADDTDLLTAVRERALADRREELLVDFPTALLAAKVRNTWRPTAVSIYRNWLQHLSECKVNRPSQPKYERRSDVAMWPVLKANALQARETGGDSPL
jgi:homoserine O-succinyltransferase/O-acetyltransferase